MKDPMNLERRSIWSSREPVRQAAALSGPQRGLTLIELMVAIALGILVAGAAIATLIVARQGFTSADASSQLRESARFAATQIERAVVEAGFENAAYGYFSSPTAPKDPGLRGFDNALVSPVVGSLPAGLVSNNRTSANCGAATGTACMNGSDVLVVRFWGITRGAGADQSMVNCAGFPEPEGTGADPRAYSIFHIATGATGEVDAEPALACTYRDAAGAFQTVSVVQGVESFQVLYGTTGVTAGVCAGPLSGQNLVVDAYLTAPELDPAGTYCANNWARVRVVRIGLVVRAPANSAVTKAAKNWAVLGTNDPSAAVNFDNTGRDPGAVLRAAADGRLRQQLAFDVHLRNAQYAP